MADFYPLLSDVERLIDRTQAVDEATVFYRKLVEGRAVDCISNPLSKQALISLWDAIDLLHDCECVMGNTFGEDSWEFEGWFDTLRCARGAQLIQAELLKLRESLNFYPYSSFQLTVGPSKPLAWWCHGPWQNKFDKSASSLLIETFEFNRAQWKRALESATPPDNLREILACEDPGYFDDLHWEVIEHSPEDAWPEIEDSFESFAQELQFCLQKQQEIGEPTLTFQPYSWFKVNTRDPGLRTPIPDSRFRQAKRRQHIRSEGTGRQTKYCVEDAMELWPDSFPNRDNA